MRTEVLVLRYQAKLEAYWAQLFRRQSWKDMTRGEQDTARSSASDSRIWLARREGGRQHSDRPTDFTFHCLDPRRREFPLVSGEAYKRDGERGIVYDFDSKKARSSRESPSTDDWASWNSRSRERERDRRA